MISRLKSWKEKRIYEPKSFRRRTHKSRSEGMHGRKWYSVKYDFDSSRVFLNHRRNIEKVIEAAVNLQVKQPIDKIDITIKAPEKDKKIKFEIGKYYRSNTNDKMKLVEIFHDGDLLFASTDRYLHTASNGGSVAGLPGFIVCEWEVAPVLKMHAPCLLRDVSDKTIFEGPYAYSLDHAKAQIELWNKDSENPCELICWPAYTSPHWPMLEVKE